jgi:peptide/nickel transport system substrate-binding protein
LLAIAVAFLAAGCFGGGKNAATTAAAGEAAPGQRTFANFRVVDDDLTGSLDPGLSYTTEGWQALWNVYLSLLGYKHVSGPDGATIVSALATSLPTISRDGLTYTLTLRPKLKYSDGTPVMARDFEHAIERDFLLDSFGARFFTNIVGADSFARTRKGHISGITADDATGKITIRLVKPQGDFQNILATPFAAPVPSTTPASDQSVSPIPATGPYMIQSSSPGRQFVLVRNPSFRPTVNVPATNPDRITFELVSDDSDALQQVIDGKADYDFHRIPAARFAEVQQKYGSQLKIYTPANTYYFFMNTRVPPFDKLAVRQAVNYAIDRTALVRALGGLAAPTENILPPTYPQYRQHDLYPYDVARAKQLIRHAGAEGAAVTIWGRNEETSRRSVAYLQRVLRKIGLDASVKLVDAPNADIYWAAIGNQKTRAQIGFADWFQDYPHPLDWFDALLNGENITERHNNNYANFDDGAVNRTIDRLKRQTTLDASVNARWAALDKQVMEQAPWAPYANLQLTDFFGKNVDLGCYASHVLYHFDFGRICMKK